MDEGKTKALEDTLREVFRQEELWDRIAEDWAASDDEKFRILAEEFGEIAMALNDGDYDNMRVEIIQTAAVCISWLASMDHSSSSPIIQSS